MAQANLDKLAKALEQVESRLAKIESLLGASGSSAPGAGAGGASVDAFDALVAAHIPKFIADSKSIATDVGELVRNHKSISGARLRSLQANHFTFYLTAPLFTPSHSFETLKHGSVVLS